MRRAVHDDTSGIDRERYWREALDALAGSRQKGRGEFEHPYRTFFSYTGVLIQRGYHGDGLWRLQIENAFIDWLDFAKREEIFDARELSEILKSFPEEWWKTS